MKLAIVTGSVVSTLKRDRFNGQRLLLVRASTPEGEPLPGKAEQVALDPGLDAGVGDTVLIAKEGAVVADLFDGDLPAGASATPANVVIVAIVEAIDLPGTSG